MNFDRAPESSLRPGSPEVTRLAWALAISLAVHLGIYGGYEVGKKLNVWQNLHWPQWLRRMNALAVIPKQPAKPLVPQEIPLMFVDVNPQQATPDAPKNAKFYSSKNSKAANPDATMDTDTPKISGKQTDVVKTEDTPKTKFDKLQPDFAALEKQREAAEESKPKSSKAPGDLVMAKPDVSLRQDDGFTEHSRPRTIKEALMRQNPSQLVGEKMKQDGGVARNKIVSSIDTKGTLLGIYDAQLIEAVQQCWYDLLDNTSYYNYQSGKVVVQFRLHHDGRVSDVMIVETTVSPLLATLCQRAITKPAEGGGGYGEWPRDMRLSVGKDYREINFTFYYN